ncbi:MAG: spore maturation protein [Ruminococcus sp.]|nr:spore maturation protein [Ruminococcus sp.]
MPLAAVGFVLFGIIRRVEVFDAFTCGAKEGLSVALTILPTLVGIITAVKMLEASGFMLWLTELLSPLAERLGFPAEIVPVALLRPVSGSGSSALMLSIFENLGVDSFAGKVVSVMAGATETTFYAVAVYYSAVGIRKTGTTLLCGLAADFTAVVMSVLTVRISCNL